MKAQVQSKYKNFRYDNKSSPVKVNNQRFNQINIEKSGAQHTDPRHSSKLMDTLRSSMKKPSAKHYMRNSIVKQNTEIKHKTKGQRASNPSADSVNKDLEEMLDESITSPNLNELQQSGGVFGGVNS